MLAVSGDRSRRARLAGVEGYVPDRVMTNAELETLVDTTDEWIVARTGIRERRIAAPDQASSDLGLEAARAVLGNTNTDAADIDLVLVSTTTPDHVFPPTATLLAHRLGATNAAACDLNAACSGFVYGLAHATAMVEAGFAQRVLVVGAETLTRYVDWTDRTTCVLFADGAGAALVVAEDIGSGPGILGFDLGADGSGSEILSIRGGGSRLPARSPDLRPGDLFIQMKGRETFRFATRVLVESSTRLLDRVGVDIADIDLFVAHQANARIIEYAVDKLGVPHEKVVINLDRYGNTSSASIPLAMAEARDTGMLSPGGLVLMVGFGAGLTWGSALARWEPLS